MSLIDILSFYGLPEDASLGNVLSSLDGIITGIIGEGVAASPNPVLGWVGSLSGLEGGKGYWFKVNEEIDFTYIPPADLARISSGENSAKQLSGFEYIQSTKQAFYFIESIEGVKDGDWISNTYYSGNPTDLQNESGLVGYWRFEEGKGTTVEDLSGKGNHGTLTSDDEDTYGLPTWYGLSGQSIQKKIPPKQKKIITKLWRKK